MLHHHHSIAEVAKFLEGGQQAVVVALVQADAWFIQHIKHPAEPRSQLAGQPDALGLAAGEAAVFPVEGEIDEANIGQKPEAGAQFP